MVQEFGLRLLVRQDNLDRQEKFADEFRLSLLASGKIPPDEVYPEYFIETKAADLEAEDALTQEGVEYDYSGVTWEVPDEEREMALLEEFLGQNHISVPGAAAEGQETVPGEWT